MMTDEPKIDFKVLDEAVKKVLSAPPQPKPEREHSGEYLQELRG